MILTATEHVAEVLEVGNAFKEKINKRYTKLEIEIDGIYQRMLLLKKKKYAALLVTQSGTKIETKGLELVRRDWCGLAKKCSRAVIDVLFNVSLKRDAIISLIDAALVEARIKTEAKQAMDDLERTIKVQEEEIQINIDQVKENLKLKNVLKNKFQQVRRI